MSKFLAWEILKPVCTKTQKKKSVIEHINHKWQLWVMMHL